ncbi:MAG TPA: 3'-5' exonuclease, partial [bacterium]|nr:3'-5' exonuclease [bacterium]
MTKQPSFIALDLETTGLDERQDEIIEVGLVRFELQAGKCVILDRYQTLVKPAGDVSYEIEKITGITNEMLRDAPVWEAISSEVEQFIGDRTLIGHNINFDLGFFKSHGLDLRTHLAYDTYELATMLVREAPAYNLGRLCDFLDAGFTEQHRALADAEGTVGLFSVLLDRIKNLPLDTMQDVADFLADRSWKYAELFAIPLSRNISKKKKFRAEPDDTDTSEDYASPAETDEVLFDQELASIQKIRLDFL